MNFPSSENVWIPFADLVDDMVHELEFVFDVCNVNFGKADPPCFQPLVLNSNDAHMISLPALIVWQIDLFILETIEYGGDGVLFRVWKESETGCGCNQR
jgi:hypothetical protein